MSNMPAIDKKKVSLQLKITTVKKIDHIAKASGLSRNEVANMLLDQGTDTVSLTAEEIQEVSAEMKANAKKRNV